MTKQKFDMVSQPAAVVQDGVRELLTEMVDIHRRRGVVLTIHIEQLAEILAAAPAQGQQVECQECERLRADFEELAERYGKLQAGEGALLAKVVTERDQARAELAAQGQQVEWRTTAEDAKCTCGPGEGCTNCISAHDKQSGVGRE